MIVLQHCQIARREVTRIDNDVGEKSPVGAAPSLSLHLGAGHHHLPGLLLAVAAPRTVLKCMLHLLGIGGSVLAIIRQRIVFVDEPRAALVAVGLPREGAAGHKAFRFASLGEERADRCREIGIHLLGHRGFFLGLHGPRSKLGGCPAVSRSKRLLRNHQATVVMGAAAQHDLTDAAPLHHPGRRDDFIEGARRRIIHGIGIMVAGRLHRRQRGTRW